MNWFDIFVIAVFILGVFGGLKDGAVRQFFSLVALLITIPIAGSVYGYLASLLSFLPGENWEGFLGYFIMVAIIGVILHFAFLIPRKIITKIWGKGVIYRVAGAAFSLLNACIGMTLFALVLAAYPIFGWLYDYVSTSAIINGLLAAFGFIQMMLPVALQTASEMVAAITGGAIGA